MAHEFDFDQAALEAAIESATIKALTGDPVTDMYADGGLTGKIKLKDVPNWRDRTVVVDDVRRA